MLCGRRMSIMLGADGFIFWDVWTQVVIDCRILQKEYLDICAYVMRCYANP
jgi:hypothetical protein